MIRHILGIDEAGLGPTLGPLTVGACGTAGSEGGLARAIADAGASGVRIADSKRVFHGQLRNLEAVVLAGWRLSGAPWPITAQAWLRIGRAEQIEHPWYTENTAALPLSASIEEVESAVRILAQALNKHRVRLTTFDVTTVLEGELNRRFLHANKAEVELAVVADVVRGGTNEKESPRVCVDRLGGRKHYAPWLAAEWPFSSIETQEESPTRSAYALHAASGTTEFEFLVGGESRVAEIAFASCLAKYTREVAMVVFNQWFRLRLPSLRATAGYPEDGRRFLRELARVPELEKYIQALRRTR